MFYHDVSVCIVVSLWGSGVDYERKENVCLENVGSYRRPLREHVHKSDWGLVADEKQCFIYKYLFVNKMGYFSRALLLSKMYRISGPWIWCQNLLLVFFQASWLTFFSLHFCSKLVDLRYFFHLLHQSKKEIKHTSSKIHIH